MNSNTTIIGILILVTAALFWLEITRQSRRFLFLRIIAIIFIAGSLAGFILKPTWKFKSNSGVIFLTKGYKKEIADSIIATHQGIKILRDSAADLYPGSKGSDYQTLTAPENVRTFVLGEGIPEEFIDQMTPLVFEFFPAPAPVGITDLFVPPITVNRKNTISGVFSARSDTTIISLIDPSGPVDSVILNGSGAHHFEVSFTPSVAGRFIYQIITRTGGQAVTSHNLPLEIMPERKLRILFLQHFPTTDSRHLKNFLADHGHAVLVRNQVSAQNFRYEAANREVQTVDRLTPDVLKQFDILLVDTETLRQSGEGEKKIIANSIAEGLGMIVLQDGTSGSDVSKITGLQFVAGQGSDTVSLRISSSEKAVFAVYPPPVRDPSIQTFRSVTGKIISGYRLKGKGKVGFQLLGETYSLLLKGLPNSYATLWAPIIEKVSRSKNDPFKIRLTNEFPRLENNRLGIEIIGSGTEPRLYADSTTVPLTEDVVLDDLWHGKMWLSNSGWHQLKIPGDSITLNFYISKPGEWPSLAAANTTKANMLRSSANPVVDESSVFISCEISPLIFFIAFMLGAAFLWLAPKL